MRLTARRARDLINALSPFQRYLRDEIYKSRPPRTSLDTLRLGFLMVYADITACITLIRDERVRRKLVTEKAQATLAYLRGKYGFPDETPPFDDEIEARVAAARREREQKGLDA